MGGGRDGEGQAAEDRDAHVESQQLDGDLALVVVHADGAVVLLVAHADVEGIGGERAVGLNTEGTRLLDGRRNDLDFFAPDLAAVAGVGIDRRDCDSRRLKAGLFEGAVCERNRLDDALDAQQIGHRAQRHVGRDPRIPHAVDDVELARTASAAEALFRPLQLILGIEPCPVHRLLIKGHETHAIDPALIGQIQRPTEALEHRAARGHANPAGGCLARIEARHVAEVGQAVVEIHRLDARDRPHRRALSRDRAACAKHPLVGEDQNICARAHLLVVEQLGQQLRSDPGRVSLHEGDGCFHGFRFNAKVTGDSTARVIR